MTHSQSLSDTRSVTLVAVFAAMITVLDSIPVFPGFNSGVWDSWIFVLSPLVGIILGPVLGAISVGIGTFAGHLIFFRDPFEFFFILGAPLGSAAAGFLYRKKWIPVLGLYIVFIGAYAAYPISWQLPLWGIWDILAGFGLLLVFAILEKFTIDGNILVIRERLYLAFITIISLELDVLFRVFVFVPGQTYWIFYGLSVNQLQILWSAAALITPLKIVIGTLVSMTLVPAILKALNEIDGSGNSPPATSSQ
ncbi:MAG: conserved membrane protein of unknown function [Candidatus Thorarchaeota archaeon]|nr:MAG: conserved membrane protein of unknown function [Candidatus Thorarchaeota archaeon]